MLRLMFYLTKHYRDQAAAQKLKLQFQKEENIRLSIFGSQEPVTQTVETTQIFLQTGGSKALPLNVLVVPTIAAPLVNKFQTTLMNKEATCLIFNIYVPLAYSVNDSPSLRYTCWLGLITTGTSEDHVIHGNGHMAVRSKLVVWTTNVFNWLVY